MINTKGDVQPSSVLRTVVLATLVGILFAVGLKIGTGLGSSSTQAANAEPDPNRASGITSAPVGGALVDPPIAVHDFPLRNQTGASMTLKDLRGKTTLLFFGYTHCPDVCPLTMADFVQVKSALGSDADKVNFVFVSIDGKRDTPAVVKEFVGRFDPGFIGLTGDDATLTTMAAEYGAYFKVPPPPTMAVMDMSSGQTMHMDNIDSNNYFVDHTSPAYVVDSKGRLRELYFYGTAPDVMAVGLRQLIANTQ